MAEQTFLVNLDSTGNVDFGVVPMIVVDWHRAQRCVLDLVPLQFEDTHSMANAIIEALKSMQYENLSSDAEKAIHRFLVYLSSNKPVALDSWRANSMIKDFFSKYDQQKNKRKRYDNMVMMLTVVMALALPQFIDCTGILYPSVDAFCAAYANECPSKFPLTDYSNNWEERVKCFHIANFMRVAFRLFHNLNNRKEFMVKLAASLYEPHQTITFGGSKREGGFGPFLHRRTRIYFKESGVDEHEPPRRGKGQSQCKGQQQRGEMDFSVDMDAEAEAEAELPCPKRRNIKSSSVPSSAPSSSSKPRRQVKVPSPAPALAEQPLDVSSLHNIFTNEEEMVYFCEAMLFDCCGAGGGDNDDITTSLSDAGTTDESDLSEAGEGDDDFFNLNTMNSHFDREMDDEADFEDGYYSSMLSLCNPVCGKRRR